MKIGGGRKMKRAHNQRAPLGVSLTCTLLAGMLNLLNLCNFAAHLPAEASKLPPILNTFDEEQKEENETQTTSALFTIKASTKEKIETRSKIVSISEKITMLQERSFVPAANMAQFGQLTERQKEIVESALFTMKAKKLAALLSLRGAHLAALGETNKALSDLNEALNSDSTYAQGYNNRAWIHAQAGKLEQALSDANKAIELAPEMAEAYDTRGTIYLAKKELALALADFNNSILKQADYGEAFFHRSLTYRAMGQDKNSQADMEKAKKLGYQTEL